VTTVHKGEIYRVGTLVYSRRQLALLFFWLLWGDVCFQLMETVVPSILPIQFEHLGTSNTAIALIMVTIPMMITAVANPIISFKSDRYRGRWGRRIPFIVWTLPFLVLSIIGLGYDLQISHWLTAHLGRSLSRDSITLLIIGIFVVIFTFFNSFVGSVFWYLFNDVVPEHLLARFMSLFRLVSLLTASLYNMFIFGHADHYATQIMTGISLLYFFGFGLMCLNVKEGKYPPAPAYADGKSGPLAALITFGKECLTLQHYWLVFLTTIFSMMAGSAGIFTLYFYQSTGMSLAQYGRIIGWVSIAVAVLIPISGWLADRFHPIRIVIAGYIVYLLISLPASLVWLFWHPKPNIAFWVWIGISVILTAPATALLGVCDPPLFMVTFPRSRYGQYCSANAMLRALAGILGGVLAGVFFDRAGHFMGHRDVYRLMPVWQMIFTIPAFISILFLYQSWKRYGGDEHYIAPVPGETRDQRLSEEITEGSPEDFIGQGIHSVTTPLPKG
jgi:maltose/moltooligosaccharide transporter